MAACFPQQKIEMSVRIEIRENPSIRYPSRYPTVTFWCAAALSLLISLQSSSVCSVITQPPVYVKKGLILPLVLITTLFNCRFDWLEMALRLGQMLGGHVKLITDESLESILDHQQTLNLRKLGMHVDKKSQENSRLSLFIWISTNSDNIVHTK